LKTEKGKNIGGSAGILNMFVTTGDAIRDRGVDMNVWAAMATDGVVMIAGM
jgi:hypothetical protein